MTDFNVRILEAARSFLQPLVAIELAGPVKPFALGVVYIVCWKDLSTGALQFGVCLYSQANEQIIPVYDHMTFPTLAAAIFFQDSVAHGFDAVDNLLIELAETLVESPLSNAVVN
jgi:hypothetical protein